MVAEIILRGRQRPIPKIRLLDLERVESGVTASRFDAFHLLTGADSHKLAMLPRDRAIVKSFRKVPAVLDELTKRNR